MKKMSNMNSTLASRVVQSSPLDGLDLYTMVTAIDDVVTIKGSFFAGDYFATSNILVPEMTAYMLDLGTKTKDKFEIASALESAGAKLLFSPGKYRVHFSGRCLKQDVGLTIELLAEQLIQPAFHKNDLKSTIQRHQAELKKLTEDTRTRAIEGFLLELYPEKHPNRPLSLKDQIETLSNVRISELKEFHNKHYGLGNINICFVGDVDHLIIERELSNHFSNWKILSSQKEIKSDLRAKTVNNQIEESVQIPDKPSADLVTGHGIGIHRGHDDYYPVMMSHFILGGNFSARLMSTVRDKEGLTYGIHSTTGGVEESNDGYWYIWGTFAPNMIEAAKVSIDKQLRLWHEKGVTSDELAAKQSTIVGMYKVGLDTTAGLASRILTTVERGDPLLFLDEYPNIINALTLEKVNDAISIYCNPDNRITVMAGSIRL